METPKQCVKFKVNNKLLGTTFHILFIFFVVSFHILFISLCLHG